MENHYGARDLSVGIANWCRAILNWDEAAALVDQSRVVGETNDLSTLQDFSDGIVDCLLGAFVDDPKYPLQWLALGLCRTPSRHRFGDRVQIGDLGVDVRRDDRIPDAGERDFEPFALLLQFLGLSLQGLLRNKKLTLGALSCDADAFRILEGSSA